MRYTKSDLILIKEDLIEFVFNGLTSFGAANNKEVSSLNKLCERLLSSIIDSDLSNAKIFERLSITSRFILKAVEYAKKSPEVFYRLTKQDHLHWANLFLAENILRDNTHTHFFAYTSEISLLKPSQTSYMDYELGIKLRTQISHPYIPERTFEKITAAYNAYTSQILNECQNYDWETRLIQSNFHIESLRNTDLDNIEKLFLIDKLTTFVTTYCSSQFFTSSKRANIINELYDPLDNNFNNITIKEIQKFLSRISTSGTQSVELILLTNMMDQSSDDFSCFNQILSKLSGNKYTQNNTLNLILLVEDQIRFISKIKDSFKKVKEKSTDYNRSSPYDFISEDYKYIRHRHSEYNFSQQEAKVIQYLHKTFLKDKNQHLSIKEIAKVIKTRNKEPSKKDLIRTASAKDFFRKHVTSTSKGKYKLTGT